MLSKIKALIGKKNKSDSIIALAIGFIMFIAIAITTNLFSGGDLPVQISGALLEAVVTALITYFLLSGQSNQEELRERNVKIFEKKQEIYHNFLEELKKIIQDGEINICIEKNIDELKDLIFQLGYLRMHTSEENVQEITLKVSEIISLIEVLKKTTDKQAYLPEYYAEISEKLFSIVVILKNDLYNIGKSDKDSLKDEKIKMKSILDGLEIIDQANEKGETEVKSDQQIIPENIKKIFPTNEKIEIQKRFWDGIEKQLKKRGYAPKYDPNYSYNLIAQYYSTKRRNKHRWYGLEFEVYKTKNEQKPITFRLEIEDNYYYGFKREALDYNDPQIEKCVRESSLEFNRTRWWYGYKLSKAYNLNFWYFNSPSFAEFVSEEKCEKYASGLVDEIDGYIKKFVEVAKVNNL
jgi:hypothetical protein